MMSNAQDNARSDVKPLTFEGRTIGQEIDTFLEDVGVNQADLSNGDQLAITIVGQSGDHISTYNFHAKRDEELGGDVVANVLVSEFTETDRSVAGKLFDQLKGGIWDWPVTDEEDKQIGE